jgi:hypothetical protein
MLGILREPQGKEGTARENYRCARRAQVASRLRARPAGGHPRSRFLVARGPKSRPRAPQADCGKSAKADSNPLPKTRAIWPAKLAVVLRPLRFRRRRAACSRACELHAPYDGFPINLG